MGVEYLVHILGRLSSIWLKSGLFPFYSGRFSLGLAGIAGLTRNLQPLGCTIHSGLLIQMKEVLQGISGGALWVVR